MATSSHLCTASLPMPARLFIHWELTPISCLPAILTLSWWSATLSHLSVHCWPTGTPYIHTVDTNSYYLSCVYECLHICLCTVCMQCLLSSEESSGTEVSGSRELPSKCWAMNPGPPQGQQVFSTRDSSPASWAHILNKLTAINLWVLINSGNSR